MILPQTCKRLPNEMISAAQTTVRAAAPFEEILDAMRLYNDKFERALTLFNKIDAQTKPGSS